MKTNTLGDIIRKAELKQDRIDAYRRGEYVIGHHAFDGCTGLWTKADWIKAVTFNDPRLEKEKFDD